ncbi:hypothetical protein LEMLEM_LOCUS26490 [Lemmus lemmus]
MYENDK